MHKDNSKFVTPGDAPPKTAKVKVSLDLDDALKLKRFSSEKNVSLSQYLVGLVTDDLNQNKQT